MKKIIVPAIMATMLLSVFSCTAQSDKSKRPSPPATVSETTANGNTITINYSKPSAKGRTIGKEIASYGKVWRTGANEATVFEISKDAMIEGKSLPAGKYGLYTIPGEDKWTVIFNKTWNQWGTNYNEGDDALRIDVKPMKSSTNTEQMTFEVADNGMVTLMWADAMLHFTVK